MPRLVKRSARLIYVADKKLSALKAHKLTRKEQLVRIEDAVSPADFEPVQRSSLGISEKAFVVTLISRGMVEKGWKEAIQVVGQTRAISGNDIHLILVGDGAEYDRLLALNLPEYIHCDRRCGDSAVKIPWRKFSFGDYRVSSGGPAIFGKFAGRYFTYVE